MTKFLSPDQAAATILPGATIGIGGLQGNFPMSTIRALARRGPSDLDVVGPAAGMAPELLIAAGRVRSLAATHMGCDSIIAVAPAYRAAVERGTLRLRECDEGTLLAGLRAAGQGLPYLPWRGGVGTDLPGLNRELRQYVDPGSGQTLLRIPAQPLDAALLRALEADEFGNVRYHRHSHFSDPAFAKAASRVIVEVERIVSHDSFVEEPGLTRLHRVDTIVVAPLGGHPYRASGVQVQDERWLLDWAHGVREVVRDGGDPADALVVQRELNVSSEDDYLDLVGRARLQRLQEKHHH